MTPVFLAVVTAIFVALLLSPALLIADRLRIPRRRRGASEASALAQSAFAPAFTPLEMADSGMVWPSELPRRSAALVLPAWPSETWADNPFPASSAAAARASSERIEVTPRPQPQPRPQPKPRAQAKPKPQPKPRPQPKPAPQSRRAQRAPAPIEMPPAEGSGPPPTAEVLRLAEERGLAAAVDFVRERTGWPFQRAAQHVALALRGHS